MLYRVYKEHRTYIFLNYHSGGFFSVLTTEDLSGSVVPLLLYLTGGFAGLAGITLLDMEGYF